MHSHRIVLIMLLLAPPVLSGCRRPFARQADSGGMLQNATMPRFHAPISPSPSNANSQILPAAHAEGSVDVPPIPIAASDAGTELTIDEAIRLARAANPDLVSASEQVDVADAVLDRARAEFYPKLGVSEQYGVSNIPVNAFSFQLNQSRLSFNTDFNHPKAVDDFHTQLQLEQNLHTGGRRRHDLHAARAQAAASALDLIAMQNKLVFRVAEAYYRLLQARDLQKVREEAVSQVEHHLSIVKSRFRNGTAVKSDVLTVEVRLAEVRESLISAENQLQLGWAVLENVVGCPVETRELPEAIPPAPWNDHAVQIEAAVNEALDSRPEIGAMASRRQAASEQVLVAEAGKRMGLDLIADYDVFTGDFRSGNDAFFVGLVLELNLFDGGRTRAEVDRALAGVRELQAREKRLMLDIELDVRRVFLQLRDAEARLSVATQAIEQASESLREIEVRYRGQTTTITELVDAQIALSNARVRRTTAQADVEIARAALERAVGRLTSALHG